MDTPERKNRSRMADDEVVRGSNGFMPINPYLMPMYYPQYMAPQMGAPMGHPMSVRGSHDYETDNKKVHDQYAPYHSMPHMPMYQPMPYMPFQPMAMPGFYQQAVPQFSYSRNYFYPDEGKKKKKKNDSDSDSSEEESKKKKKKKSIPYKTSDQIVQEFKANTLPKLRLKRLAKIQAVWRGWFVRNRVIPKKRVLFRLLREISDRKVDEFLEDKIIPDIIMEVITMNKFNQDYTLYSHEYRNYVEIADDLIKKVVNVMTKEAVKEATDALAHEFLRNKKAEKGESFFENNPFMAYVNSLITRHVGVQAEHLARESIQEILDEYLLESQFGLLLKNKYIPNLVEDVVQEGVKECCIEIIIENMVDAMIEELAPAMYEKCYEELLEEAEDKELELAIQNHIKRDILTALLENLHPIVAERYIKEQLADNAIRNNEDNYFKEDEIQFHDEK